MNIGDRVRLLHANEEGVITRISSGGRIEIEIEDGFKIPAMKNEVVVISSAERQYFGDGIKEEVVKNPQNITPQSAQEAGIFLAYLPINDKVLSVYLVNQSQRNYISIISEVYGDNSQTLLAGEIAAKSNKKISEKTIATFEEWPTLSCQFIPIHQKIERTEPSFERKVKFKASSFFKSKSKIPQLDKNGYLFKLTDNTKEIDIKQLNESLAPSPKPKAPIDMPKPASSIDLHIEKLTKDYPFMSNSEMLQLQMETFEKNLNYAIAHGMDHITFIHGIGNGVLRKEIHKYLSQLKNIKYFQDEQKSPFGYGATLVKIS
ncbi:Smr/MutS family protein [Belliella kenyensis]|uniref:Smr/MutS family protein n=1 Tax=Belliella kenyensis TaxID=1472724 RepID=A0ABV8EQL2_9BACT|nr:Smr/MutS family protein [Belliella kenyensis]MCH7403416.1 Smr/MutS family protein [Belliella kenyensis]MDN3601628.1 Smr/MutS family protein [Belliella kenyensis]